MVANDDAEPVGPAGKDNWWFTRNLLKLLAITSIVFTFGLLLTKEIESNSTGDLRIVPTHPFLSSVFASKLSQAPTTTPDVLKSKEVKSAGHKQDDEAKPKNSTPSEPQPEEYEYEPGSETEELGPSNTTSQHLSSVIPSRHPSKSKTKTRSPATSGSTRRSKTPTMSGQSTPSPKLPLCPAVKTMPMNVMVSDETFGQTCNVIHITTSALRLARNKYNSSAIALGPSYSQYLITSGVDLDYFSSHNVSLYMNCNQSISYAGCAECGRLFKDGSEVKSSRGNWLIPIDIQGPVGLWLSRSAAIGFQPELLWWRLPRSDELYVESLVQEIRKRTPEGWPLVSLHRRSMDGWCFGWLSRISEIKARGLMDCHPHSSAAKGTPFWVPYPAENSTTFQKGSTCYNTPANSRRMNPKQRQCYWDVNPWYNLCEIILSDSQKAFFRNVSTNFPRDDRFEIMLATDRLVLNADRQLITNHNRTLLLESVDPNVKKMHQRRLLLWEMWALAHGDYFITQPFSSCDSIVTMWRFALFNKSAESSFPPNCWENYKLEVDDWMQKG